MSRHLPLNTRFEGYEGIEKLIRVVDRLFYVLNSRNPYEEEGYKNPLTLINKATIYFLFHVLLILNPDSLFTCIYYFYT